MSRVRSEPTKVVFINTQYVQTDARSFKSIVQDLTGKNAVVAEGPFEFSGQGYGGKDSPQQFFGGGREAEAGVEATEFDRFFREMPRVGELYNLWSET
ncbi:LOW QUALITY PROTEIN: VQ motif-containing protein 1 [Raphanus sativus]|uniref:LOW QUALITY PROTEIN: VQ motif-containing protein 1 n=1 Tax=Raphanus sativus TaxID=3726 RepID=A0A6J0LXY8_RAPSA|nr:LOW QUALITY PROTEIN: VQ motif-containing protein 1 [Raphanus sativus]